MNTEMLAQYPCEKGKRGIDFVGFATKKPAIYCTESRRLLGKVCISPTSLSVVDIDSARPDWHGFKLRGSYSPETKTVVFDLKTRGKVRPYYHTDFFASRFVRVFIEHLAANGFAVTKWDATWPADSTDFAMYQYLREDLGRNPKQAAIETWTGQQAADLKLYEISEGPERLDKGVPGKDRIHVIYQKR